MIVSIENHIIATRSFNVELWKEPVNDPDKNSDELLTAFLDALLVTTDVTRR